LLGSVHKLCSSDAHAELRMLFLGSPNISNAVQSAISVIAALLVHSRQSRAIVTHLA